MRVWAGPYYVHTEQRFRRESEMAWSLLPWPVEVISASCRSAIARLCPPTEPQGKMLSNHLLHYSATTVNLVRKIHACDWFIESGFNAQSGEALPHEQHSAVLGGLSGSSWFMIQSRCCAKDKTRPPSAGPPYIRAHHSRALPNHGIDHPGKFNHGRASNNVRIGAST